MNSRRKTRLSVDAKQGMITISGQPVHLKPLEFVYYRMFVERYLNGEGAMSVTSIEDRRTLLDRLIHLHRESFPDADAARQDMEIQLRRVEERKPLKNFRPTISKINAKLKRLRLGSRPPIIESAGQYGAKHFRVNLEEYKVSIEAPTVSPTFASQIRTYTPNDYLATVLKEMHKKNFSQVVVLPTLRGTSVRTGGRLAEPGCVEAGTGERGLQSGSVAQDRGRCRAVVRRVDGSIWI